MSRKTVDIFIIIQRYERYKVKKTGKLPFFQGEKPVVLTCYGYL